MSSFLKLLTRVGILVLGLVLYLRKVMVGEFKEVTVNISYGGVGVSVGGKTTDGSIKLKRKNLKVCLP